MLTHRSPRQREEEHEANADSGLQTFVFELPLAPEFEIELAHRFEERSAVIRSVCLFVLPTVVAVVSGCASTTKPLEVELELGEVSPLSCAPNGPCAMSDPKGTKIVEGTLENGVPVGVWKFYDVEGRLREEGAYKDGKRNGEWTYNGVFVQGNSANHMVFRTLSDQTNELVAKGEFTDHVMSGVWTVSGPESTVRYPFSGKLAKPDGSEGLVTLDGVFVQETTSGQKLMEGTYSNSKKVGIWRTWLPTGELRFHKDYEKLVDIWFYRSGAKQVHQSATFTMCLDSPRTRAECDAHQSDVVSMSWHKTLPLARYSADRSKWFYRAKEDIDGKLMTDLGKPCPEGTVVAGAVDGTRVEQWCQRSAQKPDANKVIAKSNASQGTADDEMGTLQGNMIGAGASGVKTRGLRSGAGNLFPKEGPFRSWNMRTELVMEEGAFEDGKRHGTWRTFNEDGVETVATYKAGTLDGPYSSTRANGVRKDQGSYVGGKKNGTWTFYNANGQPERVEKWRRGKKLE